MTSFAFNWQDLEQECRIEYDCYSLDNSKLGARVYIPTEFHQQHPFNSNAYDFMQQLRSQIYDLGIIELVDLPVNHCNYTLAQKAPQQHQGNPNPFMTAHCQSPHQDTPPYPTAFWLPKHRNYYATWVVGSEFCEYFYQYQNQHPELSIEQVHKNLVPKSLEQAKGFLINQKAGLTLIDNSNAKLLYHARTCLFNKVECAESDITDSPMYAFNEMGLIHHLETLDVYRGTEYLDNHAKARMQAFLAQEAQG